MPVPSTATEAEASAAAENAASQVSDSTAASSPATSDPGRTAEAPAAQDSRSMLDVVSDALSKTTEGNSSAPSQGEVPAETQPSDPAAETQTEVDPVPSEEDLKRFHPKTRERFEKLTGVLKEARAKADEFSEKAQHFDKTMEYLRGTGLEADEVQNTLALGSLIKRGDPLKALEALEPIYQEVRRRAGAELPADLKEQVNLGYLSENHARELMRARVSDQYKSQQLQEVERQQAAERETRAREAVVETATGASGQWEASKRSTDPDFNLKQGRIAELVELEVHRRLRAGNWTPGKQDIVEICEAAHKKATDEIRKLQPPPKQIIPVTGSASPRTAPAPKSYMDVINGVLSGG